MGRGKYFCAMNNVKIWLEAFRLRTLPLSMSGIILGTALAYRDGFSDGVVFALSMLTTLLFQILSNLANDLGDHLKGADNANRVGPERSTQSGKISAAQMKNAVLLFSILSLLSASALVWKASLYFSSEKVIAFMTLGVACILAALGYTLGKKAYGYLGLGDVFVFLFFGLVSVLGVYNLYVDAISFKPTLLAVTIGLLSAAVLNLNNLRDHENDKVVGKQTLIVRIGFVNGKIYHMSLIFFAFAAAGLYYYLNFELGLLAMLPFVVLSLHAKKVRVTTIPRDLDPELKKVALMTFAFSVLSALLLVFVP